MGLTVNYLGLALSIENGEYSGMDVDLCKAVAAALFDDPTKIEYRDLSAQERFYRSTVGRSRLFES